MGARRFSWVLHALLYLVLCNCNVSGEEERLIAEA